MVFVCRAELRATIAEIRRQGLLLIIVDQDVAFLQALVDRLYIFDHGRITRSIENHDLPTRKALLQVLFVVHGDDH